MGQESEQQGRGERGSSRATGHADTKPEPIFAWHAASLRTTISARARSAASPVAAYASASADM